MKKTSSIRLFFILAALCGCIAYGGGYYITVQETKNKQPDMASQRQTDVESQTLTQELGAKPVQFEFILGVEEGCVIVYCADGETIYSVTDIELEYLPAELQQELQRGKPIATEAELYNFLESYSS